MVLKEFLVALGLQDNMTKKLNQSMKSADKEVSKFASGFAKKFALAGTAVVAFAATATVGLAKFALSLEKSDNELEAFAKKLGVSKEEAYKTKSALDVMGKSMEEIQLDPKLQAQFKELKANAADLKIPDMSEGLNTVRAITTSVLALKQTAMNALSWVGYSFLKYVAKPMEDIQKILKGFNETVKKNIPEWGDKIGKALSWIVQLGGTIIRAGAQMLGAIKKVFDAIPDGVKVAMAALGVLVAFIKMGPIGRLITIITAALLLLDDFFTFLDGGDSLLAPVWQTLIDIFEGFKKYIPDIKKAFFDLLKVAEDVWNGIIGWVKSFFAALKESGAIDNFKRAFEKVGTAIGKVFEAVKTLLGAVFGAADDAEGAVEPFLVWLTGTALPGAIGLVADIIGGIADLINWLDKVGALKPLIIGVGAAFLTFKAASTASGIVKGLTGAVNTATKGIDALTKGITTGGSLFGNFGKAVSGLKSSMSALTAVTIKAGLSWVKSTASLVAHKVAMLAAAVAQKAVTAAQWLMNAAMSANPIGLIIAAVVALIAIFVALWKNNEGFRNFFIKCWEGIKKFFQSVIEAFKPIFEAVFSYFSGIIDFFKALFTGNFEGMRDAFKKIFGAIYDFFKSIFAFFGVDLDQFAEFFKSIFTAIGDFFKNLWDGIKSFFQGVWDFLVNIVTTYIAIWQAIFTAVGDFFRAIWDGIVSFFTGVWDKITGFVQSFIDFFTGVFNGVKNFFTGLWDSLSGVVKAFVDKILGFFKPVADFFSGIGEKIASIFGGKKTLSVEVDATGSSGGHAEGGVFSKEHYAQFAEDDKPEAVIPLTKPKRAAEVMREAADYMGGTVPSAPQASAQAQEGGKSGGVADKLVAVIETLTAALTNLVQAIGGAMSGDGGHAEGGGSFDLAAIGERMLAFLANAERVMSQMGQVTQTTTAYNAVSNSHTNFNTTNIDNKQNYTINDTSGSPRTTADMVSRTQALHNRNLKGVFA